MTMCGLTVDIVLRQTAGNQFREPAMAVQVLTQIVVKKDLNGGKILAF